MTQETLQFSNQTDLKTIYCIIVTYNGMQWIEKCLQKLEESSYKVEIIVIDNGSTDQTISYIKENHPSVRVIESKQNLGFGQGNNIGLKLAIDDRADYVFLLNQDAYVEKETVARLIAAHMQNLHFGILSPIHLNGTGSDFDEHFYEYLTKSAIKGLLWNKLLKGGNNDSIIDTTFVNAAAWLISLPCLQKSGGFDPIFFHYGEDDNYAQRALYKGYKIGIVTAATVYHDKERAVSKKAENVQKIIKRDWTQFLVYACNVNKNDYRKLMIRTGLRHIVQLFYALLTLNADEITYNASMANNIFSSFEKVKKSRAISMSSDRIPHL